MLLKDNDRVPGGIVSMDVKICQMLILAGTEMSWNILNQRFAVFLTER